MHVGARQLNAETPIDVFAVAHRDVDERSPQRVCARFAPLQRDDTRARAFRKARIRIETLFRGLIEPLQVRQRIGRAARVFEIREQHAELRSPIADVVLPNHAFAARREHARHRIADDRAAQMTDMHLLGEVR